MKPARRGIRRLLAGEFSATADGQARPPDRRERLLAALVNAGLVDEGVVARARTVAQRVGQPVEQALNQMGAVSDDALATAYADISGCAIWRPGAQPVSPGVADVGASPDFLRQRRLLPISRDDSGLLVAACDPLDDEALVGLAFATGLTLKVLVASPADWRRGLGLLYPEVTAPLDVDEGKLELDVQMIEDSGAEGRAARLLGSILEEALARSASDIHIEPRRHDLRIRLRLDGRLVDVAGQSVDLAAPVVSRIKVLANLDLGERRLPQDGRATFVLGGRPIDARIATLPSAFGESAVMRLLDRTAVGLDFDSLGFGADQQALMTRVAAAQHGIFLVTGPTGSGKTTTLYALLNTFRGSEKKILSIEDPIEYHFQHVVQTQAQPAIGLTFATALRSFLRQDPDVILVGEIRDAETAQVALQAAMTGHLVLASLHANDALKAAPRLLDMGVERYQLAAALLGALAQRLARRLCPQCRAQRPPNAAEQTFLRAIGAPDVLRVFDPVGCPACDGAGFKGRVALVEGFLSNEQFASAVATGEPIERLRAHLDYAPIAIDGCRKVAAGLTTLTEVMAMVAT